jgi:ferredoxin
MWRVQVNSDCIGSGSCVGIAPARFALGDDNRSRLRPLPPRCGQPGGTVFTARPRSAASRRTVLFPTGDELGELGQRDIVVVAAAGNDGEPYPVYPAAFAVAPQQPRTPLVSVGALNTNGRTRAEFSNYGDDLYGHWVTAWEVGTSVVSTFPPVDGAARPELVSEGEGNRESADPDDFTGGFARWSGTSFAATIYAAKLAQHRANIALGAITPNPA